MGGPLTHRIWARQGLINVVILSMVFTILSYMESGNIIVKVVSGLGVVC